jgi:hypothetical protein
MSHTRRLFASFCKEFLEKLPVLSQLEVRFRRPGRFRYPDEADTLETVIFVNRLTVDRYGLAFDVYTLIDCELHLDAAMRDLLSDKPMYVQHGVHCFDFDYASGPWMADYLVHDHACTKPATEDNIVHHDAACLYYVKCYHHSTLYELFPAVLAQLIFEWLWKQAT